MVAVFRSMARGLTIWVSQNKIGQTRFRPWTSRPRPKNNFRIKVSGSMRANVRILLIRTKCFSQSARDLDPKIIFRSWTCCPRAETEVYRVISLLSMPKVPRPCVRNRDPWLKLFSQEEQNITFFRNKIHTRHRDGLKNRRKVTKKNQLG